MSSRLPAPTAQAATDQALAIAYARSVGLAFSVTQSLRRALPVLQEPGVPMSLMLPQSTVAWASTSRILPNPYVCHALSASTAILQQLLPPSTALQARIGVLQALQALETVAHARRAIFVLVNQWTRQTARQGHTIRSLARAAVHRVSPALQVDSVQWPPLLHLSALPTRSLQRQVLQCVMSAQSFLPAPSPARIARAMQGTSTRSLQVLPSHSPSH